jgi:hypothetical protein
MGARVSRSAILRIQDPRILNNMGSMKGLNKEERAFDGGALNTKYSVLTPRLRSEDLKSPVQAQRDQNGKQGAGYMAILHPYQGKRQC